jgi:hypothetical protein
MDYLTLCTVLKLLKDCSYSFWLSGVLNTLDNDYWNLMIFSEALQWFLHIIILEFF